MLRSDGDSTEDTRTSSEQETKVNIYDFSATFRLKCSAMSLQNPESEN